jgi:small-conductance mechanosensitive channel
MMPFTVYFWVESEQANVLRVSDRVATAIKLALDEAGIDIPYPHTVVLFHDATGTRPGDRISEERTDERVPDEHQTARDPVGAPGRLQSAS